MHEDPEEHTHEEPQAEGAPIGLTPGEKQVTVSVRTAIASVAVEANAILEGRYKSIALTHLETAQMFFDKAIEVDGIK